MRIAETAGAALYGGGGLGIFECLGFSGRVDRDLGVVELVRHRGVVIGMKKDGEEYNEKGEMKEGFK